MTDLPAEFTIKADLINWTAKPAGGRLTITGVDKATGRPLKVVGVVMIDKHTAMTRPLATDKANNFYGLL